MIKHICNKLKIKEEDLQLVFSDGSVKDLIGGSGYFSCNLDYYCTKLNLKSILKNKFVDKNHNKKKELHNFYYNTKSTGLRSSIEFCEFEGAILALTDLINILKQVKNENINYICLAIDNETVCNWLAGSNNIKDGLINNKINEIYTLMNELKEMNKNIILTWVHAHNEEQGNEIADRLAKLAMMNYYQTTNWKNVEHIYSIDDWNNISLSAIKKENKRLIWHKIIKKWNNLKKKKKNNNNSLTKYLVKWNINYNAIFNYEMKNLKYYIFKLFTQLRSGHNHLNSQRKWGNDKLCMKNNCNENETLIHFLFDCYENRKDRKELLQHIQQIYGNEVDLSKMNKENKLKYYLFPFFDTILDNNKMKDEKFKNNIYEKRLKIMNKIYEFCKESGRFDELFDYKYDIKTW